MLFYFVALAAAAWLGVRLGFVEAAFNANSNANLAIYYGQNSRNVVGAQGNLASYCQGIVVNIIIADERIRL